VGQLEPEDAALRLCIFDANAAGVRFDSQLAKRQAKAGAVKRVVKLCAHLDLRAMQRQMCFTRARTSSI
jgi:hypothetical protein